MKPRKKFRIASDITQGISDAIRAVDNNDGNFRSAIVALHHLETDPENPRNLFITKDDIEKGLNLSDGKIVEKKRELEELQSLSSTIKMKGVLNPIVIYRHLDKYRIIAGERRYLASLLAKKEDIPVRILEKKPDITTLRTLQWIENNERESLSLKERLNNLKAILESTFPEMHQNEYSIKTISELTGMSKAQSSCYVTVLNSPKEVLVAISENKIRNLDKAAFLASIEDQNIRNSALKSCILGNSLNELKKNVKNLSPKLTPNIKKGRGRVATHINLGKIKNTSPIRKLMNIVISNPEYSHLTEHFEKINWDDFGEVTLNFKKLLEFLS